MQEHPHLHTQSNAWPNGSKTHEVVEWTPKMKQLTIKSKGHLTVLGDINAANMGQESIPLLSMHFVPAP